MYPSGDSYSCRLTGANPLLFWCPGLSEDRQATGIEYLLERRRAALQHCNTATLQHIRTYVILYFNLSVMYEPASGQTSFVTRLARL